MSPSSNPFALFQTPNYSPSSMKFASYASACTPLVDITSANHIAIQNEGVFPPPYSAVIGADGVWVPTTTPDLGYTSSLDELSMKKVGKSYFAKLFSRKQSSSSSPPPYVIDLNETTMIEERVRAMGAYFGGAAL